MSASIDRHNDRQARSRSGAAKDESSLDLGRLAPESPSEPSAPQSPHPAPVPTFTGATRGPAPGQCAARRQHSTRWRQSAWWGLMVKSAGIALALLFLAGVGAASLRWQGPPALPSIPPAQPGNPPLLPSPAASANGAHRGTLTQPQPGPSAGPPTGDPGPASTPDSKVILNQAQLTDLRKIPGIGPKRAEAILKLREKLGRFRKAADLLRIRGIGARSLERMKPYFVIDAPTAPVAPPTGVGPPDGREAAGFGGPRAPPAAERGRPGSDRGGGSPGATKR